MIFLEINTNNETYLINSDEVCNIQLDKEKKVLTVDYINGNGFYITRDDVEELYNKMKSLIKKTFMIIPIDMPDNVNSTDKTTLPHVAKNLPDLDHCVLINEGESKL